MSRSVFTDAYAVLTDALVEARGTAGLTQLELAGKIGRPQSFVSKFERGERRIDLIEFCAIARALSQDPVALFSRIVRKIPDIREV